MPNSSLPEGHSNRSSVPWCLYHCLSVEMGFLFLRRPNPIAYKQCRSMSYPTTELWGARPLLETKRRFSYVSDAVSKKFSTAIGWPYSCVTTADVVAQGKMMCVLYIRSRLNESCASCWRGPHLHETLCDEKNSLVVDEVFHILLSLGHELERMHPALYTGVGRQASSTPVLASEKAVNTVLTGVAKELAHSGITWAKVVSLFAVTGGLARHQGHPELLHTLVESMDEALEDRIADWVAQNGGWAGLISLEVEVITSFHPQFSGYKVLASSLSLATLSAIVFILIMWLIKVFL